MPTVESWKCELNIIRSFFGNHELVRASDGTICWPHTYRLAFFFNYIGYIVLFQVVERLFTV